jgi:hypothetical protein
MKTKFFAAAAVAAMLTAPAMAHAQDGYLDLSYRGLSASGSSIDGVGVGGGFATKIGGANLQINGAYVSLNGGGGGSAHGTDAMVHLYAQNDSWSLGGFASATDSPLVGANIYGFGGEGSLYLSQVTLGATISYNSISNGGGHYNDYGVSAKWFPADNFSLGAYYDNLDAGSSISIYSLEAEYKLSNPVSLFASYGSTSGGGGGYDKYSVGARWNFGGKTLKEQDRSGSKSQRAVSSFARVLY